MHFCYGDYERSNFTFSDVGINLKVTQQLTYSHYSNNAMGLAKNAFSPLLFEEHAFNVTEIRLLQEVFIF